MPAESIHDPASLPTWAELSRALRAAHGLGQEDWAAWLEVSRKTVQRWERGDATPTDRVEGRLVEFCIAKDVFDRAERGALAVGIATEAQLRDVLAVARAGHHAVASTAVGSAAGPIGRSAELATLRELVATRRLVTIIGPGGVGKTTLALAVAGTDRVVVRLDTIRDPGLVLGVIAASLDVRAQGGTSIRDRLVRTLGDRDSLLVLDNFEHLLVAAPLVGDLLASCPRLRVLATSRAPLGLGNEVELALGPLSCVGDDAPAVVLFLDRARRADPSAAPPDQELVRAVCTRLDGLPLAIELAAARLRHISMTDLVARIDHSLAVLGRSPAGATARHRTLGDAIAWSVDLLDESQLLLFRCLSPFVDGVTLDAIEAIGGADTTLDALGALVDHNLLGRSGARYRMLETVREYATRLAAPGDSASASEPFYRWAIDFAERRAAQGRGPEQHQALRDIADEYANLRAALSGLAAGRDVRAIGLAVALCPFWDARSMLHEARRFLEPAAAASTEHDPLTSATARIWIGYFAAHQGDLAVAARVGQGALDFFATNGIDAGVGYARMVLGYVAAEEQRLDEAAADWAESERLLRAAGDRWGVVRPLNNLGELARTRGDLAKAARCHSEALAICRELEDAASLPSILTAVAQLALDSGDATSALGAASEALEIATRFENVVGQATALEALGRANYEAGHIDDAVGLWAQASGFRDQLGLPIEARDRERYEAQLAEARAHLGPGDFELAWARGRATHHPIHVS